MPIRREPTAAEQAFAEALAECGATSELLAAKARSALTVDGYQVFERLVDASVLAELRTAVEEVGALPPAATEREQKGTRHFDPLARGSRAFDRVLGRAEVLAATAHVLGGPFRISSLSCRDPLQGFGDQGLHADWGPRAPGEPAWVVTAIWMLDDFTPTNGATRVIPGSHAMPSTPTKGLAQPGRRHPDQRRITAPAGSVLVFNGHLWHSGTRNEDGAPRRTLQMTFVSRAQAYAARVTHPAPDELSPAVRTLIDPH